VKQLATGKVANLFFQLIARRYEHGSIISNRSLGA
jgi:hypothetical protein